MYGAMTRHDLLFRGPKHTRASDPTTRRVERSGLAGGGPFYDVVSLAAVWGVPDLGAPSPILLRRRRFRGHETSVPPPGKAGRATIRFRPSPSGSVEILALSRHAPPAAGTPSDLMVKPPKRFLPSLPSRQVRAEDTRCVLREGQTAVSRGTPTASRAKARSRPFRFGLGETCDLDPKGSSARPRQANMTKPPPAAHSVFCAAPVLLPNWPITHPPRCRPGHFIISPRRRALRCPPAREAARRPIYLAWLPYIFHLWLLIFSSTPPSPQTTLILFKI
ncbi:uncharacterized protein CIMG_13011 [Coccidioides immitis RS]|uniref:Uncharacterized protein n=1 Tax=Coccidioides immitis (strain RS) TaxID=246410 RepID=A0A0E1RX99_COCIM|nr:uncharacterized protein CIMG_13011 [Coccidioides immitis RS]EAS30556.1 hypothetical protein CIMG_13011 [Coccidioides immitis RS]